MPVKKKFFILGKFEWDAPSLTCPSTGAKLAAIIPPAGSAARIAIMNDTPFPAQAPVVVIGGGVMGCSTLCHLAKEGISDAVLLEKNRLTSGTTWHSAMGVRTLRSSRNLTELMQCSISLCASLEAETGQKTGWEITCLAENAGRIHDALHEAGARPAGLYAQTAMRVEKGYRAMGHEALLRRRDQGIRSRVATILFDDVQAVPLGSEPVYAGGKIVGKTTSAAFGYRVGRPVALAALDAGIGEGDAVDVDIARHLSPGRVTLRPAFDPTGARMRKET